VDLVLSVEGALRTEDPGGFVDAVVGVSEDLIVGLVVGSVIGSLEREHSLCLHCVFSVVDDKSGVGGTVIHMPLISLPATLQEDYKVMEHLLF